MKNAFKLKAMLRIAGIIALAALIGFSMVACSDDVGGGYNPGGDGNSSNWPPNSVLSQFGLSGLTAPAGATDIEWYYEQNDSIMIYFNAPSSADATILQWLTNNGWLQTCIEVDGPQTTYWLNKPDANLAGSYDRDTSSRWQCTLFVMVDD